MRAAVGAWLAGFLLIGCGSRDAAVDATTELLPDLHDVAMDAQADADLPPDLPPDLPIEPAPDVVGPDPADAPPPEAAEAVQVEVADPPVETDEESTIETEATDLEPGLDPALDDDGDGVANGVEAAEGTDPLDPSSASAWHPEVTARPRIVAGPADLDGLRARAAAPVGAQADLLVRVEQIAAWPPAPWPADGLFDDLVGTQQAQVALNAAFLAWLRDDAALTEKALALLEAPAPSSAAVPYTVKYDLSGAETFVDLCSAYDLLAAVSGVDPARLAVARANVVERLAQFRQLCVAGSQAPVLMLANNNHNLKVLGALGVCALAIPDRPEAARDANDAVTGIDYLLNRYQGTAEGGYAEGAYYLTYGGVSFLPFLAAWHRFAGGAPQALFNSKTLTPLDPDNGKQVVVQDFAVNPRTREIFERALWTFMPDGQTPPTDDGNAGVIHGALLGWLFDDPRFTWAWLLPVSGAYTQRTEAQSFVLYDGGPGTPPAWAPDGVFPEAGFALFRSGLGSGDSYLLLLGEHGDARAHGGGHEHVDATSFLLWAEGEYLALDPGYINWPNHELVRYARDHSLVLVDGEGASIQLDAFADVDAWLEGFTLAAGCDTVRVRATYRGVDVERRVTRLGAQGPFVISDALQAAEPHLYTWQLNGHGGGEVPASSFEALADGGRWSRPKAALRAVVLPTEGVATVGHRLEEHASAWGAWQLHEMLTVDASMAAQAGFLGLLVATPAAGLEPATEVLATGGGLAAVQVEGDGAARVAALNRTGAPMALPLAAGLVTVPIGLSIWTVAPGADPVLDCAPDVPQDG